MMLTIQFFVVIRIGFYGKSVPAFFTVVLYFALSYGTEAIGILMIIAITQNNQTGLLQDPLSFSLAAMIAKTMLFTICFLIWKITQKRKLGAHLSSFNWLLFSAFPSFTILTFLVLMQNAIYENHSSSLMLLDAMGLLAANIVMMFLMHQIEVESRVKEENIILQQQINAQMNSANALMEAYDVQRSMTHDFKRHLNALQGLLQADNSIHARNYLNALLKQDEEGLSVVHSNNPMIDAVLNQKYAAAQKRNITMDILFNDLSHLKITNEDIVVVLSNALDNAFEACEKLAENRKVEVKILEDEFQTSISIRNTALPDTLAGVNGSTKRNPLLHGYGLKNIANVLKKYDAEYSLTQEKEWVQFSTVLF
ncbi:MAG: GHKL domain-containing protein [Christensenellaceae bacterium]